MRATFKPTSHTFTFDDVYFVEINFAGAFVEGGSKVIAAFASLRDAGTFAAAQVQRDDVAAAYVFTRDEQLDAFYA